ncbi:patatin-like phospholipase family protein [soil metagenome]
MEVAGRKKRVGLVLSGGGARGFAHIGVISMLEHAAVDPEVIAGTSIGAIFGAFLANGCSAREIYELAYRTTWRDVFDLSLNAGLIKGEKLHAFWAEHLPADFADLKKPLAVTTTDMETGEEVVIVDGDLITALRASSCYPGAFEPVSYLGRSLADGGIVNNLPVAAGAFLNATYTVASDVTPARRAQVLGGDTHRWWERFMATVRLERRSPMVQMLLRSGDIMQSILTDIQYNLHPADLRVQVAMPHVRIESFWAFDQIVRLGEEVAYRTLEEAGLLEAPFETLTLRKDEAEAEKKPPKGLGNAVRQRWKLGDRVD